MRRNNVGEELAYDGDDEAPEEEAVARPATPDPETGYLGRDGVLSDSVFDFKVDDPDSQADDWASRRAASVMGEPSVVSLYWRKLEPTKTRSVPPPREMLKPSETATVCAKAIEDWLQNAENEAEAAAILRTIKCTITTRKQGMFATHTAEAKPEKGSSARIDCLEFLAKAQVARNGFAGAGIEEDSAFGYRLVQALAKAAGKPAPAHEIAEIGKAIHASDLLVDLASPELTGMGPS